MLFFILANLLAYLFLLLLPITAIVYRSKAETCITSFTSFHLFLNLLLFLALFSFSLIHLILFNLVIIYFLCFSFFSHLISSPYRRTSFWRACTVSIFPSLHNLQTLICSILFSLVIFALCYMFLFPFSLPFLVSVYIF